MRFACRCRRAPARSSAYVRHGTANLFLAFEPLGGWREVQVTERRQRGDWAHFVRSVGAAAQRVAVARSAAHRRVAAARDEGRRAAKPMRGGPAPRLQGGAAATMPALAGRPHHPSLAGIAARIAARLAEAHGVRAHLTTVHRAPRRAGWS